MLNMAKGLLNIEYDIPNSSQLSTLSSLNFSHNSYATWTCPGYKILGVPQRKPHLRCWGVCSKGEICLFPVWLSS